MRDLDLLKIDLQLFAEDDEDYDTYEDLDDDEDYDLVEDEDETLDELDEDLDDDSTSDDDATTSDDEEGAKKKPKDKVTHALIKQKMINKSLKQQLDLLSKKEKEIGAGAKKKAIVDKFIDKGFDEDEALVEAEKFIENENFKNTVKRLDFVTKNQDVLAKFPQAQKKIEKLMEIQKATGWSLDRICRVEFSNNYDNKIKNDQENRLLNKKKISKTPSGNQTPIQSTKLDDSDERAYQFYAKKNPGVSRKQYAQRLLASSIQKIPHNKWE
jgi:hypothetical protein